MAALEIRVLPRSSHVTRSASAARLARHHESATTATASGMRTTPRTPGAAAIELSSTDLQRAAEHRALHDRRVKHVRQPHVDRIDRLCRDLVQNVETFARRAGEFPVARMLELDVGRRLDLGGGFGDGAERHGAAARAVRDRAVFRPALRRRHVPARRRGGDQHFAGGGAGPAQISLRGSDRAARAGRGVAPDLVAAHILLSATRIRCGPLPSRSRAPRPPAWRARSSAPCPISECATRIVTVSSAEIVTQQVISGASDTSVMSARAGAAAPGANGTAKPSTKPPPAALAPTRNDRRSVSPRAMNFPLNRSNDARFRRRPQRKINT